MPIYEEFQIVGYGDDLFQLRDPLEIGGQRTGFALVESRASYFIDYRSIGLIVSEETVDKAVKRQTLIGGFFVEESLDYESSRKIGGVIVDDSAFVEPSFYQEQGNLEFSPLYYVGGVLGWGAVYDFPLDNWTFKAGGYIESDSLPSYNRKILSSGVITSDNPESIAVDKSVYKSGFWIEEKLSPFPAIEACLTGVVGGPLFPSGIVKMGGVGYIPDDTQEMEAYYEYRLKGVVETEVLGEVRKEIVEFTAIVEIGKYALLLELPEGEEIMAFSGASFDEFVSPNRRKVGGVITFSKEKLFIIETNERVFKIMVKPIYPWRRWLSRITG